MSVSQDKTASLTFQVPVWSLGMQLETKGSLEFLKNPTGGFFLRGTFAPFFTNVIDVLAEIGTVSFIFEMKVLRDAMT